MAPTGTISIAMAITVTLVGSFVISAISTVSTPHSSNIRNLKPLITFKLSRHNTEAPLLTLHPSYGIIISPKLRIPLLW